MEKEELERVREWATEKLSTGHEPPWAWYQYMKLKETLNAIIKGMESVTTVNLQQLEPHSGKHLQLVDEDYQRDSAQPHPDSEDLPLPM